MKNAWVGGLGLTLREYAVVQALAQHFEICPECARRFDRENPVGDDLVEFVYYNIRGVRASYVYMRWTCSKRAPAFYP